MRSHNLGNIHVENLHSGRTKKITSRKLKYIFSQKKKTTPQLLEHIGLQNMKLRAKANLGLLAAVCLMHADTSS